MTVKSMAEYAANGETPDVLFWVGCAGSFDQRAQKVTRSFVKILQHLNIKFAVLGTEESCTGDPAKRAGNEFVYQMLALQNITLDATPEAIDYLALKGYDTHFGARPVKRVIQKEVLNALSKEILSGKVTTESIILLDSFDGNLVFRNQTAIVQ